MTQAPTDTTANLVPPAATPTLIVNPPGDHPQTAQSPSSSKSSLLVAAGIALSRLSGLLREITLAGFLGTGPAANAFAAAIRIPNLLQNLLGEGVLSASFIPVYSQLLEEGKAKEAGATANTVLTLLLSTTGVLVIFGVLAAEPLTAMIAPGLTGEEAELAARLVAIVTPGIGLLVASAWCLGILNSHRRFFLSYVAPVLWNTAQIVALVLAGVFFFTAADVSGDGTLTLDASRLAVTLGWATVIGAALQLGVQLPTVRRLLPSITPRFDLTPPVKVVLRRLGPVIGARGVVQLSAWFDLILATFLVTGGVAALRYGQTLYLLPISLFGMSVAASELPELSRAGSGTSRDHIRALRRRLGPGLRRISYFVVPTVAAYLAAGDLVVGALLQRGAFTRANTVQVWLIIAAYAVGLLAATSGRLIQSALYGIGDTKTPAIASILRVTTALTLGYFLMIQFDRMGVSSDGGIIGLGSTPALTPLPPEIRADGTVPRLGGVGLALGTGVASWVELLWLRRRLEDTIGPFTLGGGAENQTIAGAGAAVLASLVGRIMVPTLGVFLGGVACLLLAGVAYLLTTKLLGFPAARALAGRLPDSQR